MAPDLKEVVSPSAEVPDRKLQRRFTNFAYARQRRIWQSEIRPVSEKLFYASQKDFEQHQMTYTNRYYFNFPTGRFKESDLQASFRFSRDRLFDKVGVGLVKKQSNDKTLPNYLEFDYSWDPKSADEEFKFLWIRADLGNKRLQLTYQNGQLERLTFIKVGAKPRQSRGLDINYMKHFKEKGAESRQAGNELFSAKFDPESGTIRLQMQDGGAVQDSLMIPARISARETFDKIVPSALLQDPFSEDTNLDNGWKELGLDYYGISWEPVAIKAGLASTSTPFPPMT